MKLVVAKRLSTCLCFVVLCKLISAVAGDGFRCEKTDCGCVYHDAAGKKWRISLYGINNNDGTPYFVNMTDRKETQKGPFQYDYNACTPFNVDKPLKSPAQCKGVTACQKSTDGENTFPIANKIDSFSNYSDNKLNVTYAPVTAGSTKRTTTVVLTCAKIESYGAVDDQSKKLSYIFSISSPKVCPVAVKSKGSRLSTGSILVIIFFVVLVIYLVAGILFMKYKRGATGKEVIPNLDFWSSLPGLVKDGCVFSGTKTKGLCQRVCQRDGYNEI